MGVDLLGGVLVEAVIRQYLRSQSLPHISGWVAKNLRYESVEDVVTCCAVVLPTLVVWEVVLHRADG